MKMNMEISEKLNLKLKELKSFLIGKKVIVAFSGGVDSSLLAFLSKKYAKDTLLITERSILYPEEEIKGASQFANKHDIEHKIIERDPLKDKEFQCNPLHTEGSLLSWKSLKFYNDPTFKIADYEYPEKDCYRFRVGIFYQRNMEFNTCTS